MKYVFEIQKKNGLAWESLEELKTVLEGKLVFSLNDFMKRALEEGQVLYTPEGHSESPEPFWVQQVVHQEVVRLNGIFKGEIEFRAVVSPELVPSPTEDGVIY